MCQHCNLTGETCEVCGVARRFLDDPPLDLPRSPSITEVPAFWIALMWTGAALLGAALLLSPVARNNIGVLFLLLEVTGASLAAGSSFFTAIWQHIFNETELVVPPHAATGQTFAAELRLVPYRTVSGVSVSMTLVDRHFQQSGQKLELLRQNLGHGELLERGRLPGRRRTSLSASFVAPYPVTQHTNTWAEIDAGLLDLFSFIVPALKFRADNLREHGGYFVEAQVRVGFLSRRFHKRIIAYSIGATIEVG